MCQSLDTGLDFGEEHLPKRQGISIVIHRREDPVPIRNWYIASENCYELVESKETSEPNMAEVLDRDFVAFVELPSPRKGVWATLYTEDELHEFLAQHFDCPKQRPSWHEYFMTIAEDVATRSTCLRRQVGAVAVDPKTKRILATGYNGAPRGARHCLIVGCLREQLKIPSGEREELCRAVHAEANLVAQAALHGVSLNGAVVYCLVQPCLSCIKLLINAGVKKVYYKEAYPHSELLKEFLEEGLIELVKL